MRHSTLFTALYFVGCVYLQPAVADPPAAQVAASEDAAKVAAPVATEAGTESAKSPAAATLASVTPPADPKAAPATAADAAPSTGVTDAQIKKYRAKGYKPQVHNGKTVFCHSEANLGSRLEHQVCRTAEQLEEDTQTGQEMAREIQHGGAISTRSSP